MSLFILVGLLFVGWVAAAVLGTQAYFLGEQSKPIHERNWKSPGFHALAESFTGNRVSYRERASSYKAEKALAQVLNQA
jgi:hypothetical protein